MGRLQKKKTARSKPKKKATPDKAVTAQANSTAAVKKPALFGGGKEAKKKAPLPAKKAAAAAKPGLMAKVSQFYRECVIELKKVTWPGRKQTLGSTVVVIVLVLIIAAFLGLIDMGLSSLVRVILQ